ncbi:MAG: BamA/TamA family outer membrane protein, partial [Rhizobiaceae bacterium]|nr:BamA/TamA family outer membrane protein [Rhizobiaceae bacterium]
PYFLGRRLAAGFDIYTTENTSESYDVERIGGSLRLAAPITEEITAQVAYNFKQEKFGDDDGGRGVEEVYVDNDDRFTNGFGVLTNGIPVVVGSVGTNGATDDTDIINATCADPDPFGFVSDDVTGPNQTDFSTAPRYTRSTIINEAICDSPYTTSSVSYALTYNTLDSTTDPRNGIIASFGQEFAGVGGDASFIKSTAKASYFQQLQEEYDVVGQLSVGGGNVTGLGDDLRVFDNFFKGQDVVRGFETKGIGPRQFQLDSDGDMVGDGVAIGGENFLNASAEATFPLPGLSRDFGFRGAVFADAGTLWGTEFDGQSGVVGDELEVRASAGVGLIWASPFGPLRVNYAHPFMKEDFDETQELSFGFSTRF